VKGKIIKFFRFRGFGFIAPEDGDEEIFFHISNYPNFESPEIGVEVEFEIEMTDKGKAAINIQEIS